MSTQYYAVIRRCNHCGAPEKTVPIGTASGGWAFLFKKSNAFTCPIESAADWFELLAESDVRIKDEYDRNITLAEFKALVKACKHGRKLTAADLPYSYVALEDLETLDADGYRIQMR